MVAVTSTGSVATKTLAVSASASSLLVPVNTSVSLFQSSNITITGSGTTALFLGRVSTTNDLFFQVDISVDGTSIYNDQAGLQIISRIPLSVGTHTVTYTGFSFNQDVTANKYGLTIIDLGL